MARGARKNHTPTAGVPGRCRNSRRQTQTRKGSEKQQERGGWGPPARGTAWRKARHALPPLRKRTAPGPPAAPAARSGRHGCGPRPPRLPRSLKRPAGDVRHRPTRRPPETPALWPAAPGAEVMIQDKTIFLPCIICAGYRAGVNKSVPRRRKSGAVDLVLVAGGAELRCGAAAVVAASGCRRGGGRNGCARPPKASWGDLLPGRERGRVETGGSGGRGGV